MFVPTFHLRVQCASITSLSACYVVQTTIQSAADNRLFQNMQKFSIAFMDSTLHLQTYPTASVPWLSHMHTFHGLRGLRLCAFAAM